MTSVVAIEVTKVKHKNNNKLYFFILMFLLLLVQFSQAVSGYNKKRELNRHTLEDGRRKNH